MKSIAIAVLILAGLSGAQAATSSFSGALTESSPSYNRPFTLSALSSVGDDVFYDAHSFTVTVSGSYDFLTSGDGYDTFAALYQGAFNPSSGLSNLVALNDDFGGSSFTSSGFTFALTAGTNYVFVNSSYDDGETGQFTTTLTGPGVIAAVPEPQTYALMALGLAVVGVSRRRRVLHEA